MMRTSGHLTPIGSGLLASATGGSAGESRIRHGFFTREGGVSDGIYASLNVGLGSHDSPERVAENRARVAGHFGAAADALATAHQVHSADVFVIAADYDGERPRADALVTAEPGLVLGVLTADCGPILFADPQARVIGAAHAGWRGALDGIAENTIDAMIALGARREDIVACLGPSISAAHYEVGAEFVDRFLADDVDNRRFFRASPREGHSMFDLPAYTLMRLSRAGIKAEATGDCTYADEARFFSYRRTTHRNEPDYGRQISAITITE